MRLLIIEDEIKTATYLSKGFTEQSFSVDLAHNGEDGLFYAMNHHYDLIILDVSLPKLDGWSVIKMLRSIQSPVRILFLTARDDVEDRVKGFSLGADDYLIKPFAFSELLARVQALLRRSPIQQANDIIFADLHIDLFKQKAYRNKALINLTSKEFNLLVFMVQHPGRILSRTVIAEQVWDIHFDSDTNVIDVAIRRLRKKVDDPFSTKLIHTVRGMGYVFEERS